MTASSSSISTLSEGSLPWHKIWAHVLTRPGADTFRDLTANRGIRPGRPYLWVFLAGAFDYLVSAIMHIFSEPLQIYRQDLPGVVNPISGILRVFAFPLGGAAVLLGFMLMVLMMNAAARSLGGTGNYARLAFASGALAAPFSVITALLLPFSLITYAGLCFAWLTISIGLYLIGLQVVAIMGVHQLGWMKALAALILPVLVLSPLAVGIVVIL